MADAVYRRVTWRLVPFLMVCYLAAFVDRSNIGVAKLTFARDLGLTEAAFGLGGGLFYLGYCAFEAPSNLLLARIGARRTLARIMFLWSVVSASFAFATEAWHFYLLRALLGAAEAGFFPGVIFYLSQWAPADRRARLNALFLSAMALSGVIAGPLSGAILQGLDGAQGLKGWQWLFLIEGLPGVALAAVTFFGLPDGPQEAKWLTPAQKAEIAGDLERERAAHPGRDSAGWRAALFDPRIPGLAAMAFTLISTVGGLALWLPTTLRQAGIQSPLQIGLMSAAPYVLGVAAQQLIARSSDLRGERRWHIAGPVLAAAAGWTMLALFGRDPVLALAALGLAAMGTFGATAPFWSLPSAILPPQATALGIAVVSTAGGIGGFLSPIVVGRLADATGSVAASQGYFAALATLSAAILLWTTRARD